MSKSAMSKWMGVCGGAVLAGALASTAQAGFVINTNRLVGTGGNAGMDVIQFRAFNDGSGGTGTRLVAVNVTLQSPAPLKFDIHDIDADNANDVNALGLSPTLSPNADTAGSWIRLGTTFTATAILPSPTSTDTDGDFAPDQAIAPEYTSNSVTSFHVEGAHVPPSGQAGLIANTGSGALFAVAIVPTGTPVTVFGEVAGDTGDKVSIQATDPIPEPASLSLLGLGAMGLMARRRRA